MPSYVAPVALPGPETTPKSGSASARPDVGPVLPLTSSGGDHASELLGGKVSTQTKSDPIAAKVLSRGESLAAPAGRADDFSWPRSVSDLSTKPEVSPEPVAAASGTPEKQNTAAKGGDKDQADAKKDAKEKSASNSRTSARVHHYYNYYSGRHYGGYRGHHYGWYHRWEPSAPRYYVFDDLSPGGAGFLAISSRRPASWVRCHFRASAAGLWPGGVCGASFGRRAFLS